MFCTNHSSLALLKKMFTNIFLIKVHGSLPSEAVGVDRWVKLTQDFRSGDLLFASRYLVFPNWRLARLWSQPQVAVWRTVFFTLPCWLNFSAPAAVFSSHLDLI